MKNKTSFLAITALLLLLSGGMVTTSYSQTEQQKNKEAFLKQNPDATVVREGVQTARQKEHAKLFSRVSDKTIKNLVRESLKSEGGGSVSIGIFSDKMVYPNAPFEIDTTLQKFAKQADAVVIGTITKKESNITADNNFIFTDYTLSVENVLKNDGAKLSEGQEVVIARPGGKVILDGVLVIITREDYPPLDMKEKYLLFLARVPNSDGYQPLNEAGSLLVRGNDATTITPTTYYIPRKQGLDTLITDIQLAVIQAGGKKQ